MAITHDIKQTIYCDIQKCFDVLIRNLDENSWNVIHKDSITDQHGKRTLLLFGITSKFGGANKRSLMLKGAGFVPFFVKMTESGKDSTSVYVTAGGSDDMFGYDYGRNKNICELILKVISTETKSGAGIPVSNKKEDPHTTQNREFMNFVTIMLLAGFIIAAILIVFVFIPNMMANLPKPG